MQIYFYKREHCTYFHWQKCQISVLYQGLFCTYISFCRLSKMWQLLNLIQDVSKTSLKMENIQFFWQNSHLKT